MHFWLRTSNVEAARPPKPVRLVECGQGPLAKARRREDEEEGAEEEEEEEEEAAAAEEEETKARRSARLRGV